MSIARALTKRIRPQHEDAAAPSLSISNSGRAYAMRKTDKPIDRSQISLPIELLSTTNVLAYVAPDIHPAIITQLPSPLAESSASSTRSSNDSDGFAAASSSSSISSPDFSRESSPTTTNSFFSKSTATKPLSVATRQSAVSTASSVSSSLEPAAPVPSIPSRAPSHTKQSHQRLARQRSFSRSGRRTSSSSHHSIVSSSGQSQPLSDYNANNTTAPLATRSSQDVVSSHPPSLLPPPATVVEETEEEEAAATAISTGFPTDEGKHPFGAELAQVDELAEEFNVHHDNEPVVRVWDDEEEERYLAEQGLFKFSVEEYWRDCIEPLLASMWSGDEGKGNGMFAGEGEVMAWL